MNVISSWITSDYLIDNHDYNKDLNLYFVNNAHFKLF